MASPTPRPRASGGGTPLIILGIVLALITAVLVLFLTTGGGGGGSGQTVTVVVAAQNLTAGTVLSSNQSGGNYALVSDAFHVEHLPAADVPADAFPYAGTAALASALNNQIITAPFMAGDILRRNDSRMTALGTGPANSITNHNPDALPAGDVLVALHVGDSPGMQIGAQEGDHVDILATECVNSPSTHGNCQVAQTTLQNLTIYMVNGGLLYVAVSHQDALVLKLLVETAKLDLVLRKPGDTGNANTQPIDTAWIITHFGFTPP